MGVAPRASCMYWARNTEVPNIETPTEMLATTASVNVRFLNMDSGMIGSGDLNSTSTAAISRTAEPATIRKDARDAQPNWLPARVTQIISSDTPPAIRTAPR